jgi:hypothetical protein
MASLERPASIFAARHLTGPANNCNVCAVSSPSDGRSLPAPADELRTAFGQYASATGWRWKVRIRALPQQDPGGHSAAPAVVRIDLSRADARVLADLLLDAADPAERPRGPIETWIGTGEAARRIGVEAGTIRGWVSRSGPRSHPFPPPDVRYGGRSYWQKKTVDAWQTEQRRLDSQYRAR